jgi:hypothetical protein
VLRMSKSGLALQRSENSDFQADNKHATRQGCDFRQPRRAGLVGSKFDRGYRGGACPAIGAAGGGVAGASGGCGPSTFTSAW